MSKIKFVYFDMGGVLLDFRQVFDYLAEVTQTEAQRLRQIHFMYDHDLCNGQMRIEDYWTIVQANLGIKVDLSKRIDEVFVDHFAPIKETQELARRLSQRMGVGLLTNTWGDLVPMVFDREIVADIEFDCRVESNLEKVNKPQREIYELAAKRAEVHHEEILFADDSEENVIAARQLGWKGVVFDTNNVAASIAQIESELGLK